MIHFFPTFSKNAADTEYGRALRRLGVEHRIFASNVPTQYRRRISLYLLIIPKLAYVALRSAIASLVVARPAPDVVVVGSDVHVLLFALVRFAARRRARIILGSFIFTDRHSSYLNIVRRFYYGLVLSFVDRAIVHSRVEVQRYQEIFHGLGVKFCFVPWGTTIGDRDSLLGKYKNHDQRKTYIVAAGRSGRDYNTLLQAFQGLDAYLRVVSNYIPEMARAKIDPRVEILTSCFGEEYMREIIGSTIVVVPLAVADISAGQMVVVQSMGLGKAIIVTDTPTIRDYVVDGQNGVLVPMGDANAMRAAIQDLLQNPEKRARLGTNARATFDANLSTEGHLRGLIESIYETESI